MQLTVFNQNFFSQNARLVVEDQSNASFLLQVKNEITAFREILSTDLGELGNLGLFKQTFVFLIYFTNIKGRKSTMKFWEKINLNSLIGIN